MCGIAGAFALSPHVCVDPAIVERMMDQVAHRGPDGSGIWTDTARRVCLGHRRLSIIDLATGAQPMRDDATGTVVVFNGEIYNYRELRSRLVAKGDRFRTQSDTEVLLRCHAHHGSGFLDDLRGMFAFALWDATHERLLLARDRVGKKPLYYAHQDGILHFASSFDAVRSAIGAGDGVDVDEIAGFLTVGYVPAPRTTHPRIAKLAAGTWLSADADGLEVRTYFDFGDTGPAFDGTWDQAVDRLDELVRTAVTLRLRSDVPLGVFLSGGVDSSLVAAVAAAVSDTKILTFSMGFGETGFDETGYAAAVALRIGTEHRTFESRGDTLALLPDIVRHFGEPFGDPSAVPTWLLARQTRQHVTVAVGGDGGDEGFGGYGWYDTAERMRRLGRAVPAGLARMGASALASAGTASGSIGRIARATALIAEEEPRRYAALRSHIDPALARHLFNPAFGDAYLRKRTRLLDGMTELYDSTAGTHLRRMRVADVHTYLADCLMPKVDVATMAHGLEARAPLLDHEILAFALSLPDAWILDGRSGKRILRAVLERYLPASLFERPKQGFDMPLGAWFAGDLRPLMERLPDSAPLLDTGWFRQAGLKQLVQQHASGRRDHSLRLYNLLILEEWLRAKS